MDFKTYVTKLMELNVDTLVGSTNSIYYGTISHGLVEELLELKVAEPAAVTKELGDVFAYATLLMLSDELEQTIHMYSRDYKDSVCTATADDFQSAVERAQSDDLVTLALFAAGSFKRRFRGEGGMGVYTIAHIAASAYAYTSTHTSIDLTHVLNTNISKLTDRKQRGLLTKGKGDNR